jgi:hypothetical protein
VQVRRLDAEDSSTLFEHTGKLARRLRDYADDGGVADRQHERAGNLDCDCVKRTDESARHVHASETETRG